MPLNASALSTLMRSQLLASPASGATDNAALTAMCDAIAAAVVLHITSSATVAVAGATSCGAGVGTCTATGTVI
jgi:hypothetical protein